MAEEENTPRRGRPAPIARLRPGQVEEATADRKAAARALFEGVPGMTCERVAEETGVPVSKVWRWKLADGWKPAVRQLPELSARAAALANRFKVKMSELGKPLDDSVAAAEAAREVATEVAVDLRAQVLDRHRKEWAAPRQLAYQAIKEGATDVAKAFERAKLAKITSETLTLIQAGECRAFGIRMADREDPTVVVVDRPAQQPAASEDAPAVSPSPDTSTGTGDAADGEVF